MNPTEDILEFLVFALKSAREIVAEAWHITIGHRDQLFWLGIIPAFFSILVTGVSVYYQVQAFRHSPLFSDRREHYFFDLVQTMWNFLNQSTLVMSFSLAILVIVLAGWFFVPMICKAAITHLVGQAWRGEKLEKGLSTAFSNFFPIFEITALKRGLTPLTFFTEWSFITRNLNQSTRFITPIILFFMAIGMVVMFLFLFTTQAIILREERFSGAIVASFRAVADNLFRTFRVLMLFLLVELRVIINVVIVLLLPIILAGLTGIFAGLMNHTVGVIITLCLLLTLVLIAAYLTGVLFVFSEAMWTVAFLEFQAEKQRAVLVPEQKTEKKPAYLPTGEQLPATEYFHF